MNVAQISTYDKIKSQPSTKRLEYAYVAIQFFLRLSFCSSKNNDFEQYMHMCVFFLSSMLIFKWRDFVVSERLFCIIQSQWAMNGYEWPQFQHCDCLDFTFMAFHTYFLIYFLSGICKKLWKKRIYIFCGDAWHFRMYRNVLGGKTRKR